MENLIWVETFRAYLSNIIGIYRKTETFIYPITIVSYTANQKQKMKIVIILAKVKEDLYMFVKMRVGIHRIRKNRILKIIVKNKERQ